MSLKDETSELDLKIETLKEEIDSLDRKRNRIINGYIRNCKHEYVATTDPNGYIPWERRYRCICLNCGLAVQGSNTRTVSFSVFSFEHSRICRPAPNEKIQINWLVDNEQSDALSYPKRFTKKRLNELFVNSPWSSEEVLAHNGRRNYSLKGPYNSYSEWYDDNFSSD